MKANYVAPHIEVVEIEIEDGILNDSNGKGKGIDPFQAGDDFDGTNW